MNESAEYDAYHCWLGISPEQQPPNLYRLLGLELFESNRNVIRHAVDDRMHQIRRRSRNQFAEIGDAILTEVAEAKLCLLDSDKRAAYDSLLKKTLNENADLSLAPKDTRFTNVPSNPAPTWTDREFVVGSDASCCDMVVDQKDVSSVHAKLIVRKGEVFIRDLASTNGTFVNRRRIQGKACLQPSDVVSFGDKRINLRPFWNPSDSGSNTDHENANWVITIGHHEESDFCLEHETVSRFHARVFRTSGELYLEDFGSTNGTRIVKADGTEIRVSGTQRLDGAAAIRFADVELGLEELLKRSTDSRRRKLQFQG